MTGKPPAPGSFIAGLAVGAAIGGIVLMPVAVLTLSLTFSRLRIGQGYAFLVIYIVAAAVGLWGVWRGRGLGFANGMLVGGAAGLLGLTALCNVLLGGLGNMQ